MFRTSLFAAAALAVLVPTAHAQTYSFGGHTYFLTHSAENWNTAEAEAVADGGHLAAVTSDAENTFLTTTFASGSLPVWLGGTDFFNNTQTHVYQWTSGEPFVYTHWQPGEPSNTGGNEDYIALNWHFAAGIGSDHSVWNDTPLNGTDSFSGTSTGPYFGIVELAPAAAPEPSQFAAFAVGLLGLGALAIKAKRRTA